MTELNKALFNHSDSLSSEKIDAIQEEVDAIQEGSYMDEPGIKSVTIDFVKIKPQDAPKDGWICVEIGLKDVNGRGKSHYQMVATTKDWEYPTSTGKNKLFALKGLQKFGDAFGLSFRGPGMFDLLAEMFGSTEALVGKQGSIRLGYSTTTFPEEHGDGFCIMSNGNPILDPETGEVLVLPTRKDVATYCINMLKKKVSLYLEILEFLPSAVEVTKEPEILGM